MTTATARPSAISKLLAGLNQATSDPTQAGVMGLAQSLLQASAPHMLTPVTMGQALGAGMAGSQQFQRAALQNALQRAVLPFQVARTQEFERALSGQNGGSSVPLPTAGQVSSLGQLNFAGTTPPAAQGAAQNGQGIDDLMNRAGNEAVALQFAGIDPSKVPFILEAQTAAKNAVTPFNQPAGTATVNALQAAQGGLPVRGAPPAGSVQNPYTGATSTAPGALPAAAAISGANAGGAAAATYPYQQGLKASGYFKRSPGEAGGFNLPAPPLFNPQWESAPPAVSPQAAPTRAAVPAAPPASRGGIGPNPSAPGSLASAKEIAATPQGQARLAATMRAAVSAPRSGATLPSPQQPAGNGLVSRGLSPAQVELQKQAAQQTGADEAEGTKETEAANAQLARLTEMQTALNRIPLGGNLGKIYNGIANVLNYSGIKLPGLEAMQEFTKYRTNFVADAARKMGSRISYQEVSYLAKGVPDFTLAGNAPKALLAQLSGAAQYDIARNQARQYYMTSVPNPYGKAYMGTDRGFEQWWQKTGVSPGAFMFMNTLFALPAADRGQYLQNFRSTMTGKAYLAQYGKAQEFLKKNPALVPFWSQQQ